MRETRFISQNKKNWEEFEAHLNGNRKDPEKLSDLFIQITDDLSYARTHYPNRAIRVYLNNLARKIFSAVYFKRHSENILRGIKEFFAEDAPALVWKARYEMLVCLAVFILSFTAGVVSSRHDIDFPAYILGADYVAMTEKNISEGDPMAVYKQQHEATMFLGISYNNLFVSFRVFVFGLLFGIGSLAILIYNGIMVGTFQYFFVPKGVFLESFATIWLHGVPEIFAIIFSAGAGLRLARGFIFPGTYSRLQSFQDSAWESLRLMLCIIPVFLFAAFIEGFITRFTELPVSGRLFFIILNTVLLIVYFILYPLRKYSNGTLKQIKSAKILSPEKFKYVPGSIYNGADVVKGSLSWFGTNIKQVVRIAIISAIAVSILIGIFSPAPPALRITDQIIFYLFQKLYIVSNYELPVIYLSNCLVFSVITYFSIRSFIKFLGLPQISVKTAHMLSVMITISLLNTIFFIESKFLAYLLWSFLMPMAVIFNYHFINGSKWDASIDKAINLPFTGFVRFTGSVVLLYLLFLLFSLLVNSPLLYFYQEIVTWNFNSHTLDKGGVFFNYFSNLLATYLFSPFLIAGILLMALSSDEIRSARTLKEKISRIKGR